MSIIEFSVFSKSPSVSGFGVEKLIVSCEGILLFWKKESLKLHLSRWTEEKRKNFYCILQCQLKPMGTFSNTAKGRSYTWQRLYYSSCFENVKRSVRKTCQWHRLEYSTFINIMKLAVYVRMLSQFPKV